MALVRCESIRIRVNRPVSLREEDKIAKFLIGKPLLKEKSDFRIDDISFTVESDRPCIVTESTDITLEMPFSDEFLRERIREIIETVQIERLPKKFINLLHEHGMMTNVEEIAYVRDWHERFAKCELPINEGHSDKKYIIRTKDGKTMVICRSCISSLYRMHHMYFYDEDPWNFISEEEIKSALEGSY